MKNQQNHLWVTLWEQFSQFNPDLYRCFNQWIRNLRKICKRGVKVLKIDFKVDNYGSFLTTDFKTYNDKILRALKRSCQQLSDLDFGFEDNLGQWNVEFNVDEGYKVLKGFQSCQSFVAANIISHKETFYQWKRYSKIIEMIQKGPVGSSVNTRMGRIVGYPRFTGAADAHFSSRMQMAGDSGITRDEIGVWVNTGLLAKLDGRHYDLDEADTFIREIKTRLEVIRKPTLTKRMVLHTMWRIPTNDILSRFATIPKNLVVIGDKRIMFAYARHEIKTYTTGDSSPNFKWTNLLDFLEDAIKRHSTIGASIDVYHHRNGFIGTVKKMKQQSCFFEPISVEGTIPGITIPTNWELAPTQQQIGTVFIQDMDDLKEKLVEMFK